VYSANSSNSNAKYALKKVFLQSSSFENSVKNEIDAFTKFQHANIVELYDFTTFVENNITCCYILFPLAENGSLRKELDQILNNVRSKPAIGVILRHFLSICDAVNVLHLHDPPYVHQDIKPDVSNHIT
jgi:serine/threonine protein kinase